MHTVKDSPPPIRTLETWLTLEVLTPQPIPKPKDLEASFRQLVRLDQIPDPWAIPSPKVNSREKGHYWFVFLGELDLKAAVEKLLKKFPDKTGELDRPKGHATLAAIVLDSTGRPIEDKTFLSSFAWGYGKVLSDNLNQLHLFVEEEETILEDFNKELVVQDEEGKIQPLNNESISWLCDSLIQRLKIPFGDVKKPGIAIRVPVFKDNQEAPEPELLNSFYIEDLYRVSKEFSNEENIGKALKTYMHAKSEKEYRDVAKEEGILKSTLHPANFPLARWPVRGRYPLYLMQQAAVNHINKELQGSGLVAINGPPGTGKTTLLRDIVANVVFQRANVLAGFNSPEKVFTHSGKIRTGTAFTHLYEINESLLGFEIVAASNNNKAVENISKDIPGIEAVADDFENPLRYFSTIANYIYSNKDDRNNGNLSNSCWGMSAAVLGNSANKNAFVNDFWWHRDYGMRAYLVSVGRELNEESPKIASLECSPVSLQQAKDQWKQARVFFKAQKQKVVDKIARFTLINDSLSNFNYIREKLQCSLQEFESCNIKVSTCSKELVDLNTAYDASIQNEKTILEILKATKDLRPGFFSRLFNTRSYKKWKSEITEIVAKLKLVGTEKQRTGRKKAEIGVVLKSAREQLIQADKKRQLVQADYDACHAMIIEGQKLLGENFPDQAFWSQPEKIKQKLSPWIESNIQNERDELFAASFQLHRAFIDVAAKQIKNNLTAMMYILKNGKIEESYRSTITSLWATLFMVVPLVSTTFASFSRLFSTLKREEIGWLLLDESGQATPQSAVGAIWRSKRVVVIGDPMQVPPVVTIPKKLLDSIFHEYNVEADDWAPPVMSVQTLADRTCWFGSTVDVDDGEIWVGSPLRVHRRCLEPMFSIANNVAYNGLMVSDTPSSQSIIGEILGDSHWMNIESQSLSKWSQDEGELALSILHRLFDEQLYDPDIFIITPFRNVADRMKNIAANDQRIRSIVSKEFIWKWVSERIGTVHTFQGKEAEAVVFLLGATGDEHSGARVWAGNPPNILNVAVTRAKKRLYVIGSHREWQNAGAFGVLSSKLKVTSTQEAEPDLF